ncbi:MAG: tRNA (adenosine(37)-N6)-threonylcarbamoyltransferase complex ATPase subunit type 1 TsaE [Candidatus Tyloplasma litorale]|nr:MAG: tRNA (adenosine(37)-N6)-threonylcarbamoyltransferase complex ATPase subunit type 1 TsaE [Mycoplasmatales bacterium]
MKLVLKHKISSVNETINFGKKLIEVLPKQSNLFFIQGEIGSGKTTLIKGIVNSLGIKDQIKSPTYGYKRTYDGVVHYDFFLIKKMNKKELLSLISEDLENNKVFVEWGNKFSKLKNSIFINIKIIDENSRMIFVYKN